MGVLYEFVLVVGVPAEALKDKSGASLLERAKADAAQEGEEDPDVAGHLDDLVPAPLRVYAGGAPSYGGEETLVVGKALLKLDEVKGLLGWDVAGPLSVEALVAARQEVCAALAKMDVDGPPEPRVILLGRTF